jgi:hypothetical protein
MLNLLTIPIQFSSYGYQGFIIIKSAIASLFRIFSRKPRVFTDGTIAHTTLIGNVAPLEFLLNVMCPAAVTRLIQQDEEQHHARIITFEEAFDIAVATSAWGDLVHPDPDNHISTFTVDDLFELLKRGEHGP